MSYQVLARKWRPADFTSIVGQEPVVTALRNAVSRERIAQAYLFAGIRGVGKTTAARVLAKALNCETRRDAVARGEGAAFRDPCNECTSCRQISDGSDLDVIEIDAATYSKVEQVRELTESLQYGPAHGAYKVVVLDEIHRLSRQAFDALLKIVEEPPAHLVFVFATTEVETVPATILSRCQEFHFRRVPSAELVPHLREMCETEGIEANDRSLRLIARAGEGSIRDSVALLDQLATFGSGAVSDEDAVRLLGGLDFTFFHALLSAILDGSPADTSAALGTVEEQGWDPRRVHTQFLGYCRDALHSSTGASVEQLDLPEDDAKNLSELAGRAGYENLLRLLQQLLKSEELIRRSEAPVLAVEIAWLRAAELPRLVALEDLLASGNLPKSTAGGGTGDGPGSGTTGRGGLKGDGTPGGSSSARPAVSPVTPVGEPSRRTSSSDTAADGSTDPETRQEPPSASPRSHDASFDRNRPPDDLGPQSSAATENGPALSTDPYEAFIQRLRQRKQSLAARLHKETSFRLVDGRLDVSAPRGDRWITETLQRDNNRKLLDEIVIETWGASATWRVVEVEQPVEQQAAVVEKSEAETTAREHPVVQSALDLFSGTIESIEPLQAGAESDE